MILFSMLGCLCLCKKHELLQKTEDEQVWHLVESKGSFSAGAQWCTFGFQLLRSSAIIRAQTQQIDEERKGNQEARSVKLGEKRSKILKAQESLALFNSKSTGKASAGDWKNIIKFILPRYDSTLAPSKFASIGKAKAKLDEFEAEKGKTWVELVEEEVAKALGEVESEAHRTEGTSDWQGLHLDDDSVGEDAAQPEADAVSKGIHNITTECQAFIYEL